MLHLIRKPITKITSNNVAAKLIFGVDCKKGSAHNQLCCATILMKLALDKYVKKNDKVLDIGTGSFAIHSIWLTKNRTANVLATEIDETVIRSAKRVMAHNKATFPIEKRDLFKGIRQKFDWAIVNPPFANRQDKTGYQFIDRVLKEAPKKLKLLIAVNTMYVDIRKIPPIIKRNNYQLIETFKRPFLTSRVYVLKRK